MIRDFGPYRRGCWHYLLPKSKRAPRDPDNYVCTRNVGSSQLIFSPPEEIFGIDGAIVVVVIAVVLFGGSQIPKLARSLGSAQKEFKKGLEEGNSADPEGEA